MTRKKFLQDLADSKTEPPAHIINVNRYDSDGIAFTYWYTLDGQQQEVDLRLITTDVDTYPDGNTFMLFTDEADVSPIITDSLVHIQAIIDGSSVSTALREISGGLQQALADHRISSTRTDQPQYESELDDFYTGDQSDDYDDDDTTFGLGDLLHKQVNHAGSKTSDGIGNVRLNAAKDDLRAAKEAGFKIGVHGDLLGSAIVCVAIRIGKLGISEEALQAWGLFQTQYLVLLVKYQGGYKSLSEVMEESELTGGVQMRVALSDTYKPGYTESLAVFTEADDQPSQLKQNGSAQYPDKRQVLPLFINQPINALLRERFSKILKFRKRFHLPWGGAERLFNDRQGTLHSDLSRDMTSYQAREVLSSSRAWPDIVTADTFAECDGTEASLHLVAMQFLLRHVVRCTEFCLVCHCKVEGTFEALKPYVCSSPLCLYQFLAFGFGPSAEWEILSQPYVVDLLISLCYAQALAGRLRELPLGINLKIPFVPFFKTQSIPPQNHAVPPTSTTQATMLLPDPFKAHLDLSLKTMTPCDDTWAAGKRRITNGDWIVLDPSAGHRAGVYHCQIIEDLGSKLRLGTTTFCPVSSKSFGKQVFNQSVLEVDCFLYDTAFDELPDMFRNSAITTLLDALPSINLLRKALSRQREGQREPSLNSLRKYCPSACLDLLRWIIASNRSCIMQVDDVAIDSKADVSDLKPSEDRVSGMDEWMQFRFAQGAPDKEQRFIDCVRTKSTSSEYPTIFAWHGSPLCNWHSIIRQGLNFDEVIHGRASGHGVYMSPWLNTSMGYVNSGHLRPAGTSWPGSELKISSVISLQEVVNAPGSFVSQSPHLVVAQKDWIQTRYLFVRTDTRHSTGSTAKAMYAQDPQFAAKGSNNEPVSVPITAIASSRRLAQDPASVPEKKRRKVLTSKDAAVRDLDDCMSVMTDLDDLEVLKPSAHRDNDVIMTDMNDVSKDLVNRPRNDALFRRSKKTGQENVAGCIVDKSKTNFVPGTLDISSIRFMSPPRYASVTATKALMRAFAETIKVQATTPLHDLGFYIDPNRMDNMYQWIVELHSFDKTLPLAKDMKEAGLTSIVFEMLFTSDFPFSPPFVRVVKPRFLDPVVGGGGHITAGGAICMELLTSTGWSAVNSMESVLLQVRLAMSERERPARLLTSKYEKHQTTPYAIGEAIAAYKRFCDRYGWKVPKELDSLATM